MPVVARRMLMGVVLAALAALAVWAGGAGAQGFTGGELVRGSDPAADLLFHFTVSETADLISLELSQPAELASASVGGKPCEIVRDGERLAVFCEGTFEPGRTHTIVMKTAARYPANGGAKMSGTTAGGQAFGPLTVSGPADKSADLVAASARVDRERELKLREGNANTLLPITYTIRNLGPDTAEGVRATLDTGARFFPYSVRPDLLVTNDLPRQGSFSAREDVVVAGPSTIVRSVKAESITPDPDPANNARSIEVEVEALPDTSRLRFTARSTLVPARAQSARPAGSRVTGRARNARVVYVAIARRLDRARVRSTAAGCAWLRNTRGRVRRERGRRCDEPVWLRARGRRLWRLNIRRPLPPGSYTVLSRAVAGSGVTEAAFSRRDGNRAEVRIGRR